MKIISWNCCLPPWNVTRQVRLPKLVNFLNQQQADIICLQEVFFKKDARFIIEHLSNLGLSYSYHFKDLLTLSRFPMTKAKGYVFSEQGRLFSWAALDVIYAKGFQIVEIQNNGESLVVANAHLLSAKGFSGKFYQAVRTLQIQEIIEALPSEETSLICGDLNFQPESECYSKAIIIGYVDSFKHDSTPTFKQKKIDYILYRNLKSQRLSTAVVKNTLSDHSALSLVS